MTEIPFSRLKPPSELFRPTSTAPAAAAGPSPVPGAPVLPTLPPHSDSAQGPAKADQRLLTPLPAARQTPAPVPLGAPLSPPRSNKAGKEIAPGVLLDTSRRSKDGAVIRVVTIDPAKTRIVPLVEKQGASLDPERLPRDRGLIAAINASFFSATRVIGDVQVNQLKITDDAQPALDKVTDQRYFLAVDKNGQLTTGKGGLSEQKNTDFQAFLGGFPALFTASQASQLEKDIRSGAFAQRAQYGGASPASTISRSFVGINAQGHLLLVAAGEGRNRAQGVSIEEGARLLKSLGAREAYILDGGGSTSLYVKDTLYARTDGRRVHSYLGIYAR